MLIDTHAHASLDCYEPIEILLTQMQYNGVDKTTLVQVRFSTDSSYIIECMRRFPGRFSVVCRVDVSSSQALIDLERWQREGADAVRLTNFDRSPGNDSLAIWKKAQELGMSVSVGGPTEKFASREFFRIVEQFPELKFVFEHLAGMRLRDKPSDAQYSNALKLANYPNTYIKIHGMGEICLPPFPFKNIPPYIKMAYDAFGPRRMMWGSNYPIVAVHEGYRNALRFTMDSLTFCSKDDLDWIFGKTALSVWNFH